MKNKTYKQNDFDMEFIGKLDNFPIDLLKFNEHYQRGIEKKRKEPIKKSIMKTGLFLPDKAITINQRNEIVDGQHRVLAAKECGLSHVPVSRYLFRDPKKEVAFFVHINNFDQRLNAYDYWFARFIEGDPVAVTIYKLESDPMSIVKNMIAIKGKQTQDRKFSIPQILEIIEMSIGMKKGNWTKDRHQKWVEVIIDTGWPTILNVCNSFFSWFLEIFGQKINNPQAYTVDSFRAIKFLYIKLKEISEHQNRTTISKMKTFSIDTVYATSPIAGKKMLLINHYNKGKSKNKIEIFEL